MIRGIQHSMGTTVAAEPESALTLAPTHPVGAADRFCAWAGRARRRMIFTVFPLQPGVDGAEPPLAAAGGIALGVLRDHDGSRRVLWAAPAGPGAVADSLHVAVQTLAATGRGELHVLALAAGDPARLAILDDLGFPRPAACAGLIARGRSYGPGSRSSAAVSQARSGSTSPRASMCA